MKNRLPRTRPQTPEKEGLVQRRVSWYNAEGRKNFKMPGKLPGGWKCTTM